MMELLGSAPEMDIFYTLVSDAELQALTFPRTQTTIQSHSAIIIVKLLLPDASLETNVPYSGQDF
ncbi:MAG TPA: hypothetical protein DCE18_14805 [Syntrophobacteraceae bacterium]|nr:hypothetical protein [Syntrophobacteraceae bacterium]